MSAVPKPRETLRMMIVDDSNVMRRRIERSQQNDRLEVVGTAVNGLDAVTKFKQLMPDVMTLDLTMPEMDGIECVEHVLKISPMCLYSWCPRWPIRPPRSKRSRRARMDSFANRLRTTSSMKLSPS